MRCLWPHDTLSCGRGTLRIAFLACPDYIESVIVSPFQLVESRLVDAELPSQFNV